MMIMKIVKNKSISLLSSLFILYVVLVGFYTYNYHGYVSYLEVSKFIVPLLSLFILGFINDEKKYSLLKVGIFFFVVHFFISLFFYSSFQLSDGRLSSMLLGRGANEFALAIAFMMILIHNKDLLPRVMSRYLRVRWIRYLAYFMLAVLLFNTQSRSGLIMIGTYYFVMNMRRIPGMGYKKFGINALIFWFLICIILTILVYLSIEYYFFSEHLNFRFFLSGRYDVWENNILYFRDFSVAEVILGSDFTTKNILLNDLRYFSDSHSLYLDLFKYFGLFGVSTFFLTLILNFKKNQLSKAILYAFLITNLVVVSFRYPYIFYVNILVFTMISIRWDLIKK